MPSTEKGITPMYTKGSITQASLVFSMPSSPSSLLSLARAGSNHSVLRPRAMQVSLGRECLQNYKVIIPMLHLPQLSSVLTTPALDARNRVPYHSLPQETQITSCAMVWYQTTHPWYHHTMYEYIVACRIGGSKYFYFHWSECQRGQTTKEAVGKARSAADKQQKQNHFRERGCLPSPLFRAFVL